MPRWQATYLRPRGAQWPAPGQRAGPQTQAPPNLSHASQWPSQQLCRTVLRLVGSFLPARQHAYANCGCRFCALSQGTSPWGPLLHQETERHQHPLPLPQLLKPQVGFAHFRIS